MKNVRLVLVLAFALFGTIGFISCDWFDDDDCPSTKYTLWSTATNSYDVYSESYCKSISSDRGYKCYSYDSSNHRCYGYK